MIDEDGENDETMFDPAVFQKTMQRFVFLGVIVVIIEVVGAVALVSWLLWLLLH